MHISKILTQALELPHLLCCYKMGNGVGMMFHSTTKSSILPVIIKQGRRCFVPFLIPHMHASIFGKKCLEETRIEYGYQIHWLMRCTSHLLTVNG
jgi:hypothetical protein